MHGRWLGWVQLIGAALVLYFDRAVFSNPGNESIAIAILAVIIAAMGIHHLFGENRHR